MAKVKIRVDLMGRGTVEVDGHDISDRVTAIEATAAFGELTRVKLTLNVTELDFEAEVDDVETVPATGGEA